MDSKQFKDAAFSSIEEIANYYDNITERRVVSNVEPGYLRKLLPTEAPQEGQAWPEIQKDIEAKIMPGITHWQSPNFMAFFPASSSFPSILGEMYSAAFTAAAFNWICSPAVTELETIVLDWLAKVFALPDCYLSTGPTHGGGVIHGTASEAILTVMVAARDKYLREATAHLTPESEELEDAIAIKRSKLIALGSSTTHSSTKKAAQIAGVRFKAIPVTAENNWALTGADVKAAIQQCRAKGLEPFYLTTTLGTTDCCAVDDFGGIADALEEVAPPGPGEVWVHVDAAYAGAALICPEYQHFTKHFGRYQSFNMNMHKWLLTNFDCSACFVRDRRHLVEALSIMPPYLRNQYSESGLVTDYRDWQIPLGRRFRSLKIWFVLRTYGVKGLQEHVRKGIKLGERFADLVKGRADLFEVLSGPTFALTVFRLKGNDHGGRGAPLEEKNELTKKTYEAVNEEGKIYITSTVMGGEIFAIRIVTSTPFVEEEHVKNAFDILVAAAEEALGEKRIGNGKA